ncbi:MAG: FlgO family outer membrane protein [Rivihabitans pingtungensis]
MVELKLRRTMYGRRTEGELALTREIAEVARQHNARAILLGSYGLSGDMVFKST